MGTGPGLRVPKGARPKTEDGRLDSVLGPLSSVLRAAKIQSLPLGLIYHHFSPPSSSKKWYKLQPQEPPEAHVTYKTAPPSHREIYPPLPDPHYYSSIKVNPLNRIGSGCWWKPDCPWKKPSRFQPLDSRPTVLEEMGPPMHLP